MGITGFNGSANGSVLQGLGSSSDRVYWSDANKNGIGYWMESAAASGDARGIYVRLYLSGAGSGEAARFYATVNAASVATGGTVNGAHISLSHSTTATHTISGQGNALRLTLDAGAASRTLNPNTATLMLESNIGTGNTATGLSFVRVVKTGSVDLPIFLRIDDDQCLKGDGTLGAITSGDALVCQMPNGSTVYIPLVVAG